MLIFKNCLSRLFAAISRKPQISSRRFEFSKVIEHLELRTYLSATYAPSQLLVQFHPSVPSEVRTLALGRVNAVVVEEIYTPAMEASGAGMLELVTLPSRMSMTRAMRLLNANPLIASAEPNWIFTTAALSNDPYYTSSQLWGMYGDATIPANSFGSQAGEAWANGNVGSSSIVVGIIDEGIDSSHPDLAPNMWTNPGEIAGNGIDDDRDGYIDDIHGWDFFNDDNTIFDGTPTDNVDRHGTHVAGTIGAVGGNAQGVAGVNWHVQMISAKFIGPTGGNLADAIQAIDYLTMLKTKYGVNIVASNNSWGGGAASSASSALQSAIVRAANAGILFIAAAGNEGNNNDTIANYPANYDTTIGAGYDNVISVAAIDKTGNLASFSNYGATTVDLGAPGVGINSTLPFNSYGAMSGTSMATPHVTGAVALYAATHPGATAATIRNAIIQSARTTPTPALTGKTTTGGRLNIGAMVAPIPTLSINDIALAEGDSGTKAFTFTVTVTLSAPSLLPVTVTYSTADGTARQASDYQAVSGTLTFLPGITRQTITVLVNGDKTVESNESFFVNLTHPTNATLADAQGMATVLNDDAATPTPALSINDVSVVEGNSGITNLTFTVSLSAASTQTVTVQFGTLLGTATPGIDYRATSGTLSFSPGTRTRTITVSIYGDRLYELNENFAINLGSPVNATISDAQGIGTIINDDSLRLLRIARAKTTARRTILQTSSDHR